MSNQPQLPKPKGLGDVLISLDRGNLWADAETTLQEIVRAVQATGKAGSLTIKVGIKQTGDVLTMNGTLSSTVPEHDRSGAIYWSNDDGQVFRADPTQYQLALKQVEEEPTKLRKVENE